MKVVRLRSMLVSTRAVQGIVLSKRENTDF